MNAGSTGGRQTRRASSRRSSATESAVTTTTPEPVVGIRKAGASDGQERQRDHGQGDVPVPGRVLADLVVVQADLALGLFEGLLNLPIRMRL